MPKQWFPLESNPSVLNAYIHTLGADLSQAQFYEMLGVEDWAIEMVPKPARAIIALYPISASQETHREEEDARIRASSQILSPSLYYMKQTVSNACGTVAILHALLNAHIEGLIGPFPEESYCSKLLRETKDMTPDERAVYLERDDAIEAVHETAAVEGQSHQLDVNNVDTHFICFCVVDGSLYEFDGRKNFPINHGPSSVDTLLEDSCKVVKQFMARDPDEVRFSLIALSAPSFDD